MNEVDPSNYFSPRSAHNEGHVVTIRSNWTTRMLRAGINISCQLLAKPYPLLTPPLSSPTDPPLLLPDPPVTRSTLFLCSGFMARLLLPTPTSPVKSERAAAPVPVG